MNVNVVWFPDYGHIVAGIFLIQGYKRAYIILEHSLIRPKGCYGPEMNKLL